MLHAASEPPTLKTDTHHNPNLHTASGIQTQYQKTKKRKTSAEAHKTCKFRTPKTLYLHRAQSTEKSTKTDTGKRIQKLFQRINERAPLLTPWWRAENDKTQRAMAMRLSSGVEG